MATDPTRSLRALVDAGIALASELDLDALLQRVADVAREVLAARYAAVGVVADDGTLTRFIYSGIDSESADRIGDLPVGRGILGVLIEEGRPLRLREIADHPRSYGFPANHPPMKSFLGIPIVVRNHTFGRLYATEKIGAIEFSKDDERIGMTLAAQAGTAIENARLYDEVTRLSEALRDMAILEERERIAKDLHDGVIQSIYAAGLALQASSALLERDPAKARERIDGVLKELDDVVRDVRSYIFQLRPKIVEEYGLTAAIEELVKEFEVNTLAHARLDVSGGACDLLPLDHQQHVVQIVREILSNIARHAEAQNVQVVCRREGGRVQIVIDDDGKGFDAATVARGHGLRNIESRAQAMGGGIEISPRSPSGTRHLINLPLEVTA